MATSALCLVLSLRADRCFTNWSALKSLHRTKAFSAMPRSSSFSAPSAMICQNLGYGFDSTYANASASPSLPLSSSLSSRMVFVSSTNIWSSLLGVSGFNMISSSITDVISCALKDARYPLRRMGGSAVCPWKICILVFSITANESGSSSLNWTSHVSFFSMPVTNLAFSEASPPTEPDPCPPPRNEPLFPWSTSNFISCSSPALSMIASRDESQLRRIWLGLHSTLWTFSKVTCGSV
mmetsp:Transcript_186/g.232  ORF Transcript_186/g.232 Transcript_186/m.232 type:complete len:238 (+) Transcript_186:1530-2243(+)